MMTNELEEYNKQAAIFTDFCARYLSVAQFNGNESTVRAISNGKK